MTRKRFLSSLGALCLSAALILSSTTFVQAEENADTNAIMSIENVSGGDAGSVSGGDSGSVSGGDSGSVSGGDSTENPTEPIKLATPTGLAWGDHWQAQWNGVPEAEGYYAVEVYRDGQIYYSTHWSGLVGESVSIDTCCEMYDSGVYKFRIKAMADYDDENYVSGEWSEFSAEKEYVKPDKALGTTTPYFGNDGFLYFSSVEGAGGYRVSIYYRENEQDEFWNRGASWSVSYSRSDEAGVLQKWYIADDMDRPGQYCYTVEALSGNIDLIANGGEGPRSEVFDTENNAENVLNNMDAAIKDATSAADAVEKITESNTEFALQNAMQNNADVLQTVADLDARHMTETGVSVQNSVSAEASAYVNTNDIKLVGAALNADAGNIGLDVSVPEKKEFVSDKHYKNSVQLDIKLVNDGNEVGDLKMPVNITMPIPAGLDASKLVILHYSADGSFESVKFRVNADNTITFTVTHFSNFVFAEQTEGGNGADGGATVAPNGGNATSSTKPATTSPKTMDTTNNAVWVLLMTAGLCAVAAFVYKKREC